MYYGGASSRGTNFFKRLWLWLIRLFDDTAYICVECGRIRSGVAERVRGGWVCGLTCSDINYQRWQAIRELQEKRKTSKGD